MDYISILMNTTSLGKIFQLGHKNVIGILCGDAKTVKIILKGNNFTHNCTAWQQNFNHRVLCKMEQKNSKNRELNSKKETENGPTQLRTVIQKSLWMIQIFLKPSEQENGLKLICLWTRHRHMQRTGLHIRKNSNQKYFICTEAGHIESMKKLN